MTASLHSIRRKPHVQGLQPNFHFIIRIDHGNAPIIDVMGIAETSKAVAAQLHHVAELIDPDEDTGEEP